jgi:signal transduction histidine kinase
VALLDAKKQYVRYISHEIRTPLNSMFLGLQLLADDLENCSAPRDVKRYENLCDVQLSCSAALDTLNDLLTFEKLDSGILQLHVQEMNARKFVSDCVKMFSAQANAHRVSLEIKDFMQSQDQELERDHENKDMNKDGLPDELAHKQIHPEHGDAVPLESHDTISLDKFKIAQVIRNLISNALKFTPAGGSVTVTPSFVPREGFASMSAHSMLSNQFPVTSVGSLSKMSRKSSQGTIASIRNVLLKVSGKGEWSCPY